MMFPFFIPMGGFDPGAPRRRWWMWFGLAAVYFVGCFAFAGWAMEQSLDAPDYLATPGIVVWVIVTVGGATALIMRAFERD